MRLNYDIRFLQPNSSDLNASITLDLFTNFGTAPQGRIYLDGSGPPAFSNFTFYSPLSSQRLQSALDLAPGLYVVQFKNNEIGIITLAKVRIKAYDDLCWNDVDETLCILGVRDSLVQSGMIQNTSSPISTSSQVSIDEGSTYKNISNSAPLAFWSNSELNSLGLSFEILEVVFKRTSSACQDSLAEVWFVEQQVFSDLEAFGTVQNETSSEANDGEIFLTVTGGSGNYSFEWADGPVIQNRINLPSGNYSVTITDNITEEEIVLSFTVTEPQPPTAPEGTFLKVPLLNSLTYVVEPVEPNGCGTFQELDNVLLRNQRYGLYERSNYFQKVATCDTVPIQFFSDFAVNFVELYNYHTDELVKSFNVTLEQENLGLSQDAFIRIENHTEAGKSRVYFQEGVFPLPLETGDTFEIINNLDGFNGVYEVITIETDILLGVQYLIINKNYGIVDPTSNATGRFIGNATNYNVYESIMSFVDVAPGCYYSKIRAVNALGTGSKVAVSEPISVKVTHRSSVLIAYRHFRDGSDILWSTGYIGRIRIEGAFGHKRFPGGEKFISRDSDYTLFETAASKTRGLLFDTGILPPYMHEKLSCLFDLNFKSINNVEVGAAENYEDPDYIPGTVMSKSSIKVEGRFFDRIANNGIGSVLDGGFLLTETGFLKL